MTAGRNKSDFEMPDDVLDRLLAQASLPAMPNGAQDRLLAALPAAATTPARTGWIATIPLAASLAVGIYLGAYGLDGGMTDLAFQTAGDDSSSYDSSLDDAVSLAAGDEAL